MPEPGAGRPSGNLAAALEYATAGLPVFPCHPERKSPLIKRGFLDASTDLDQVRAWWGRWPDAVVGLPTGATSARWVLDIDVRDGKGGDDALFAWEQEHGELPLTPMAMTASGGFHYHWRWPTGRPVPSRTNVAPGIDVRGDGGYVIAPGSVGTLGEWQWEASQDPAEGVALADAPGWLLDLVCERRPVAVASGRPVAGVPPRDEIESLLAVLDADGDYQTWVSVGMALHGCGAEWAFDAWDAWSARGAKYPGADALARKWASFDAGGGVGLGTVYALAKEAGWVRNVRREEGPIAPSAPFESYGEWEPVKLKVVAGTEHDPRPVIQIRNGELPEAVDDAEHYLIESRADVYQHGTRLVRVGRWETARSAVDRPSGAGVLIDVGPEWLADTLTRLVRWERFDARKGEMRRVDCPSKVASTLLARVGSWRFPGLVGFCDSPTLDAAGRVVSAPGYDEPSGLYLSRPPEIEPIERTDRHLAERGAELLCEAVETFPFVSEADRSACLALIMTALLRRILPAAPIGGVSASTPGTGKSKLVDVVAAIATGRPAAVVGLGSTPEELEKRLDSILLKGDTLASFDNVDRPVKSDTLCQVATQAVKSVRVMGLSKIVEAPTNCALLMTGNNLTLVGDLVRRCVLVNLDAGCERPELRVFDRDAVGYVLERRGKLIRAALMVSKAYIDAGCPDVGAPPYGSFEVWDRMIRRALIWAGMPDPLRPAEAMRDQDHELVGMRDFLREWRAVHPDPITAAELSELIRSRVDSFREGSTPEHSDLQDAAVQVMGDLPKWGARELGYRLRAMAGRIFDGRRVAKASKSKGGARWLVEVIE